MASGRMCSCRRLSLCSHSARHLLLLLLLLLPSSCYRSSARACSPGRVYRIGTRHQRSSSCSTSSHLHRPNHTPLRHRCQGRRPVQHPSAGRRRRRMVWRWMCCSTGPRCDPVDSSNSMSHHQLQQQQLYYHRQHQRHHRKRCHSQREVALNLCLQLAAAALPRRSPLPCASTSPAPPSRSAAAADHLILWPVYPQPAPLHAAW